MIKIDFARSFTVKSALQGSVAVLLLSPTLGLAATCVPGSFSNSLLLDATSNFNVRWDVCGSGVLQMEVSADATGWLGIGFTQSPFSVMAAGNTDIIFGGFDSGGYLSDRLTAGFVSPSVDSSQDVTLISASETATTTTFEFQRFLNTGDFAEDFDLSSSSYFLTWAYNLSSDDTNLAHTARGVSINAESFVPVPAAIWLFGSGLLVLAGVAKRKT